MKTAVYVLGVMAIVVFIGAILLVMSIGGQAFGQQPRRAWQLGICVDDQFKLTSCRLVGGPLDDEKFCVALRDALKAKIVAGRVHCTRVLVDVEYET